MKKFLKFSPILYFIGLIILQMMNPELDSEQMADKFYWAYIGCFVWPFIAYVGYRRIKPSPTKIEYVEESVK